MIQRPIYYRCAKCQEVTESCDLYRDFTDGGYRGEPHFTCPRCGDDDLEEVVKCAECHKWLSADAYEHEAFGTYSDGCMCRECLEKEATVKTAVSYGRTERGIEISSYFERFFTRAEIEALLLRCISDADADAKEYCMEDEDAFSDFLYDEPMRIRKEHAELTARDEDAGKKIEQAFYRAKIEHIKAEREAM